LLDQRVLCYLPTRKEARTAERALAESSALFRSFDIKPSEIVCAMVMHVLVFISVEDYQRTPLHALAYYEEKHIKVTIFLYRLCETDLSEDIPGEEERPNPLLSSPSASTSTSASEVSTPEAVESPRPLLLSETTRRLFILRQTAARGVVVAWIDDFPCSNHAVNELEDATLWSPNEQFQAVVEKLETIRLDG